MRPVKAEDAEAVARLFLGAKRAAMPYLPELHSDQVTFAWIADVVLAEHETYVAEVDGALVGFLALEGDLLGHLYVLPDRQGVGVGSRLLAQVKRLRPDGFRLYVFQRNTRARTFYERRGLSLVELGDGSWNEEGEPDALYEWRPGAGPYDPARRRENRRTPSDESGE